MRGPGEADEEAGLSEALDGLFSRYVPAATFAMVGPAVVLLAVLYADPWAALLLLGCGLLVPVGTGSVAVLSRTPMSLEQPASNVVKALQSAN